MRKSLIKLVALNVVIAISFAGNLFAQSSTNTWFGGDGDWFAASNWSDGAPDVTDTSTALNINSGDAYYNPGGDFELRTTLNISGGQWWQTNGTAWAFIGKRGGTGNGYINLSGNGIFNTGTCNALHLGDDAGSTGYVHIADSAMMIVSNAFNMYRGEIVMDGGTFWAKNSLSVGENVKFDLKNGIIDAGMTLDGAIVQMDGMSFYTTNSVLTVSGASSSFVLSNTVVTSTGTFTVQNGANFILDEESKFETVGQSLSIGSDGNPAKFYVNNDSIAGFGSTTIDGGEVIVDGGAFYATNGLTMRRGSGLSVLDGYAMIKPSSSYNWLRVGWLSGDTSTITVSGGQLDVSDGVQSARFQCPWESETANGAVVVNGGIFNMNNNAFYLGCWNTGYGKLTITDGVLTNGNFLSVEATSDVEISGGAAYFSGNVTFNPSTSFDMSGGVLDCSGSTISIGCTNEAVEISGGTIKAQTLNIQNTSEPVVIEFSDGRIETGSLNFNIGDYINFTETSDGVIFVEGQDEAYINTLVANDQIKYNNTNVGLEIKEISGGVQVRADIPLGTILIIQ